MKVNRINFWIPSFQCTFNRTFAILLGFSFIFMISCGGGGGGSSSSSNTETSNTSTTENSSSGGGGSSDTSTSTASNWSFTADDVNFGISGVSPEAFKLEDGSVRLYVTDIGMPVYNATDGLNFSTEIALMPTGSDPTVIQLSDKTYRMYYVDNSPGVAKEIATATSPDGLTWTAESKTGITSPGDEAWGVPDSVELPDGRIRLYWVDSPSAGSLEVIKSAISSDGVTFTEEEGYRTENGYVDSFVLKAEDGDWLALFSTTPHTPPQKIYVGTSTDGLTWTIEGESVISSLTYNSLDPTGVDLGDGSYRIYYSVTTGLEAITNSYSITSGILRPKE